MATGVLDFREAPGDAARRIAPDVRLTDVPPYLMWALTAQADAFPSAVDGLDPAGLHAVVTQTIRRSHRDVRRLVELAAIEATTHISRLRSSLFRRLAGIR
jgi:hypothetical protein